jgi:hypothetical protein
MALRRMALAPLVGSTEYRCVNCCAPRGGYGACLRAEENSVVRDRVVFIGAVLFVHNANGWRL